MKRWTLLYNFDFPATHATLRPLHRRASAGAAALCVSRAAAYLFYELDRLGVLESEFLTDDERHGGEEQPAAARSWHP